MVLNSLRTFFFFALILSACGPATERAPQGQSEVSEAEARRLYTMKCGLCHGDNGKLMLAGAPDLSKSRLSLNDRIGLITYGKGAMPPQNGVLNAAEIRAIALYIESFRN
jgi:mono/diheme cytochrome c family protein